MWGVWPQFGHRVDSGILHPMRRWHQFRLRTLFGLTLVICVGLTWLMNERRKIAGRNEVFLAMGAEYFEFAPQPVWRVWLLGNDEPGYAISMGLMGTGVNDSSLAHLQ